MSLAKSLQDSKARVLRFFNGFSVHTESVAANIAPISVTQDSRKTACLRVVCEFSGEIFTISELCQRNSEKFTSPIVLDAHWGSEEVSGDSKDLCLDGTQYGDISRFINHRCLDANLIEIPVHVESMDLHYYHLALFTTRDVKAMEELTWDYGVEFNDHVFPTTPFHCQCGSENSVATYRR